jgi:hypothetical protein
MEQIRIFPSENSDPNESMPEVTWEEVKHPMCTLLDAPKTDGGPAEWGEHTLKILSDAGLTRYETEAQRARVLIRLAVIGRFYQRYRRHREGFARDPSVEELLEPLNLQPPRLLQLIPADVSLGEDDESAHELGRKAFRHLLSEYREEVLDALVSGFGGRQYFFVWLWLSDKTEEEYRYDKEEYWGEEEEDFKERVIREYTDSDLKNRVVGPGVSFEKQDTYEWVMRQIQR